MKSLVRLQPIMQNNSFLEQRENVKNEESNKVSTTVATIGAEAAKAK